MDEGIIAVYTDALIALSQKADTIPPVKNPDISATAISPVCGSVVTVYLTLESDTIKSLSFTIDACALTKAVAAIIFEAAIGQTRDEIKQASNILQSLLEGLDAQPSGAWKDLIMLAPVRDYPSRHNAVMLPFEAIEKALHEKLGVPAKLR